MSEILNILMFGTACVFLLMGFPVAFTLSGVALGFALLGWSMGIFDMAFISALPNRIFGNAMSNEVLIAVPLFVFMGVMLERSKVAEELLETMGKLFGNMRGGLGISVSIVGMLLAASTGIVGATVVTMGLLSLPTMMKRGYSKPLACGSICAAGTLGQIIPPSIVLVLLGDQISNAYVDAQRSIGNWSPEPVSVGDLFAGAMIPGLTLVGLYIVYQICMAIFVPSSSPAVQHDEDEEGTLGSKIIHALIPPVVLIIAVLGSILAGVATPTEAAAVGAVGATLLAGIRVKELNMPMDSHETDDKGTRLSRIIAGALGGLLFGSMIGQTVFDSFIVFGIAGAAIGAGLVYLGKLGFLVRACDQDTNTPIYAAAGALVVMLILSSTFDLRIQRDDIGMTTWIAIGAACAASLVMLWGMMSAINRVWGTGILDVVNKGTMEISSMVFVILIGASMFSLTFRGLGGDDTVHEFLTNMPGGTFGAILVVMIVMFILGFFLDFIEITFVVVPIVSPIILQADGISPVWLGVMMAMNLQTSFLTPPFGFALFYLRGVAPKEVSTMDIYKGVAPFVLIQIVALAILWEFPILANWLPQVIFGSTY